MKIKLRSRSQALQNAILQGKRHRPLDERAACHAHAGQGLAGIRLASVGKGRRVHQGAAFTQPGKQYPAGRWVESTGRN